MKILVLVKHVPDTETKVKLAAGGKGLDDSEFKYMVNPYDEFAIEEAVRTQEKQGGESVVVSLGPTRVQEGMRKAMAMGIDRGVWINTEGHSGELDSFSVATALSKVIAEEKPDVVYLGQKAIDDDSAHIGPMLAELSGMPHVQVVTKVEWQDGAQIARVEREVEGGMMEVYEVKAPMVLGAHKSLNEPRFPPLPGIMKAKKKPLAEKKLAEVLSETALVTVRSYALPADKAPGKVFKGEALPDMVKKVVGLLRSEAKVI
ncbi:electron transfer flavoprotein beta subunit/FixA family protein [bacterium]|nr:electron transfer flavoprotein beta subunit/FixA family protein [bacterium]